MTTPADPGAIDGLPCECRFYSIEGAIRAGSETDELVDPDEPIRECALHKALRATNKRLNRRCQAYEAGIAEKVGGESGGSLGRSLANAAATYEKAQNEALRERVAELEPQVADGVRRSLNCQEWQARAEAAEARVVELAGALEEWGRPANNRDSKWWQTWEARRRAVLSATPAKALERARAVEEVVKWAGELRRELGTYRTHAYENIEKALAKLDALGKEEG